jgi:hypothetical protein
VQRQIDMWNRSDFAALYQTLSPAVRRRCEYSVALGNATATRTDWGEISLQNLEVRVAGSTASVTGSLLIAGEGTHRISADNTQFISESAAIGTSSTCRRPRILHPSAKAVSI